MLARENFPRLPRMGGQEGGDYGESLGGGFCTSRGCCWCFGVGRLGVGRGGHALGVREL